jgi:arginase
VGLAAATGACWTALCRSIAGFHAVEERNTVLVGARDVDPGEKERLDSSEVTVIPGGGGPGTLAVDDVRRAVTEVADRVDGVYLHIDFDAIDPSLGRANEYAVEGGLAVEDVRDAVSAIADLTAIRAASFTAFDPDLDPDFHATAIEVVASVLDASAAGDASVA